jgi:hypothetical protein
VVAIIREGREVQGRQSLAKAAFEREARFVRKRDTDSLGEEIAQASELVGRKAHVFASPT